MEGLEIGIGLEIDAVLVAQGKGGVDSLGRLIEVSLAIRLGGTRAALREATGQLDEGLGLLRVGRPALFGRSRRFGVLAGSPQRQQHPRRRQPRRAQVLGDIVVTAYGLGVPGSALLVL